MSYQTTTSQVLSFLSLRTLAHMLLALFFLGGTQQGLSHHIDKLGQHQHELTHDHDDADEDTQGHCCSSCNACSLEYIAIPLALSTAILQVESLSELRDDTAFAPGLQLQLIRPPILNA